MFSSQCFIFLISLVGRHAMRTNLSVQFAEEHVCTSCLQPLPYSYQILLRAVPDSFALQEVSSYAIPLHRVLTKLPIPPRLVNLVAVSGDPELLDARSVSFLLRDVSPVCFLGLCSMSVCVSISRQVSLCFEGEMSLTPNFL